MIIYIFSG